MFMSCQSSLSLLSLALGFVEAAGVVQSNRMSCKPYISCLGVRSLAPR